MTGLILAPDLALPRFAQDPGEIPPPREGLVRAARADGREIVLAGARSLVRASGLAGVLSMEGGAGALTGPIRLAAPPAANLLATPRTLVRERIGAGGGLRETLVVPERLPGAVIQWSGDAPARGWVLDVELPLTPTPDTRVRVDGPLLRWAAGEEGSGGVMQLTGPVDGAGWTLLVEQGRARGRIAIHPHAHHPVTLLVSAVEAHDRLPSLPALGAVTAHRRRDTLEPHDAPGLVVRTGVPDLDDGVAWARAALRARLVDRGRERRVRGDALADLVRGALAAGEVDVARAALADLGSAPADAEALALWVAWTGRPEPLLAARTALEPALAEASDALRRRVADAAEAGGDEAWAADLRRPLARDGGRRLPTLGAGGDEPSHPAPLLESGEGPPDADTLRRALGRTCSDASDWGVAALRRALAAASRRGLDVLRPEAALTLDLLVRGLLGVEPDAGVGRVHVGPCFPAAWTSFRADGLQVGDARLGVEMTREGPWTRLVLRQSAGGAPVTWIVEPRLVGAGLVRARVDGAPAEIDADQVDGRVRPRLQIPADRERVVELEVSAP